MIFKNQSRYRSYIFSQIYKESSIHITKVANLHSNLGISLTEHSGI